MIAKYIQTMEFTFTDIEILNADKESDLLEKIKENELIKIKNGERIEYINASYIMYFELEG
jgi:hypothetical protein